MGRRAVGDALRSVIPRHDVVVEIDIAYDTLLVPSADQVAEGFTLNRDYEPLYPLGWVFADEIAALELELLNELAASTDSVDFDEAADEVEYEEDRLGGLELGVAGTVSALVEAGCITCYSCRGHQDRGIPTFPQVRVAADHERAAVLAELAGLIGCGVESDEEGLLWVFAPSLVELMALADEIRARSNVFDSLPLLTTYDT